MGMGSGGADAVRMMARQQRAFEARMQARRDRLQARRDPSSGPSRTGASDVCDACGMLLDHGALSRAGKGWICDGCQIDREAEQALRLERRSAERRLGAAAASLGAALLFGGVAMVVLAGQGVLTHRMAAWAFVPVVPAALVVLWTSWTLQRDIGWVIDDALRTVMGAACVGSMLALIGAAVPWVLVATH